MLDTHLRPLQQLRRLRRFSIDCALKNNDYKVPASGGTYGNGGLSARYDAECWDIELFVSTIGPAIASLELRHVNQTMFTALLGHADMFATYHDLKHLKLDITEGVWDWNGAGSPLAGASADFIFPFLGVPAVQRLELVVCDMTLGKARAGPLDMLNCNLLTELSLDVRSSLWWLPHGPICLFEGVSPVDLPSISLLEIKDSARNSDRHRWDVDLNDNSFRHRGRAYPGLVRSFLGGIPDGMLPQLKSLWVDEHVLVERVPETRNVGSEQAGSTNEASWMNVIGPALYQMESLRVGLGPINHTKADAILGTCDPTKLTQFGFEWDWRAYGRNEPLSSELLARLARFPKLTDVHILFPRPGTELPYSPDPPIDARTAADVASIFACNGSICRVGISNAVVWERHPSQHSGILLVSDGSAAPNPAVPKFYHAGFISTYSYEDPSFPDSDNTTPPRPVRSEEIEQLRDLLQRIMQ
ncbi:hypothetical protein C8J57DRAFT_489971 [Mycena rebaudengoi]|nr:hypothetical protein C8J57DRAFT_489971 [Mycena rebaudengoi]